MGHVKKIHEADFVKKVHEGRIEGEGLRGKLPVKWLSTVDKYYWRQREWAAKRWNVLRSACRGRLKRCFCCGHPPLQKFPEGIKNSLSKIHLSTFTELHYFRC